MQLYNLSYKPYYDANKQCYRNILTLNEMPKGPLANLVRRMNPPLISPFITNDPCDCNQSRHCIYAIYDADNQNLMCMNRLSNLMSFLMSNGYKIDTAMTKILSKVNVNTNDETLICYISYE